MARKSASSPKNAPPAAKPASSVAQRPQATAPIAASSAVASTQSGGLTSSIGGSIMSGMATGVGMSMASRAVDAVMGPRETTVVHKQQEGERCKAYEDMRSKCSNSFGMDCTIHADALRECRSA